MANTPPSDSGLLPPPPPHLSEQHEVLVSQRLELWKWAISCSGYQVCPCDSGLGDGVSGTPTTVLPRVAPPFST